jgi:hypothetical protein
MTRSKPYIEDVIISGPPSISLRWSGRWPPNIFEDAFDQGCRISSCMIDAPHKLYHFSGGALKVVATVLEMTPDKFEAH